MILHVSFTYRVLSFVAVLATFTSTVFGPTFTVVYRWCLPSIKPSRCLSFGLLRTTASSRRSSSRFKKFSSMLLLVASASYRWSGS